MSVFRFEHPQEVSFSGDVCRDADLDQSNQHEYATPEQWALQGRLDAAIVKNRAEYPDDLGERTQRWLAVEAACTMEPTASTPFVDSTYEEKLWETFAERPSMPDPHSVQVLGKAALAEVA